MNFELGFITFLIPKIIIIVCKNEKDNKNQILVQERLKIKL